MPRLGLSSTLGCEEPRKNELLWTRITQKSQEEFVGKRFKPFDHLTTMKDLL